MSEIKIYAVLVLMAGLITGVWLYGRHQYSAGAASVQSQWDLANAKANAAFVTQHAQSDKVTAQVVTRYVPQIQVVHDKAATIVKQVPIYVTQADDSRYQLPLGFVRLHDAAASGVPLPASASSADGAPSAITPSAAASVIASNYGECRGAAEQLIALQQWVRGQSEVGGASSSK